MFFKKSERPSVKEIVELMKKNALEGAAIQRADGTPIDPAEKFEQEKAILKPNMKFMFQCVGCGDPVSEDDAETCACGGFTCPLCRSDDDDTCTHTPPEP